MRRPLAHRSAYGMFRRMSIASQAQQGHVFDQQPFGDAAAPAGAEVVLIVGGP